MGSFFLILKMNCLPLASAHLACPAQSKQHIGRRTNLNANFSRLAFFHITLDSIQAPKTLSGVNRMTCLAQTASCQDRNKLDIQFIQTLPKISKNVLMENSK